MINKNKTEKQTDKSNKSYLTSVLDFFSMSQRGGETTMDNDEEEIKNNKKGQVENKLAKSAGGAIGRGNYHTADLN